MLCTRYHGLRITPRIRVIYSLAYDAMPSISNPEETMKLTISLLFFG